MGKQMIRTLCIENFKSAPRGIRMTVPKFMFSSFGGMEHDVIRISFTDADGTTRTNEVA